ncbi:hypothetical protein SAMD00019534_092890 [Acytostelium subglobosum LB1]|uniref:hypothetical protein n=1 Tax=Acytostelium subglobosum LB1 TaxID=1410327 RepID=UPI000644C439|nr:hypothetical protein SAMD00019534_092890 [Acytostelium subglobosum LB1]GAM26114.1 hypothetical protein SAMD00019534_092890 [Acytostelium subglobosum LB1]|eukprot:XP_012751157.1 hypothetical protein SAMD00019534_092890 [Acytostelium subglobosum LB1]
MLVYNRLPELELIFKSNIPGLDIDQVETTSRQIVYRYNRQLLRNTLPPKITELTFCHQYSRPIPTSDLLPASLTSITFGKCFDSSLNGVLPPSLVTLVFTPASIFNKEFNVGSLPNTLTTLKFGYLYNQPFKSNVLPDSLLYLIFGEDSLFNKPIFPDILPQSLVTLSLGSGYLHEINARKLPRSLRSLSLGGGQIQ